MGGNTLLFDDASGNPNGSNTGGQILSHNGTRTDGRPRPDFALFNDGGSGTHVASLTELDVTADCCVGVDVAEVADLTVMGDTGFDIKDAVSADTRPRRDQTARGHQRSFTDFDIHANPR